MLRGTTLEGQERSGRREHARGRIRPGGRAEQAAHVPEDSTAAAPAGTAACFRLSALCSAKTQHGSALHDQAGMTRPEALLRAFSKRFCTSAQFTMFQIALT